MTIITEKAPCWELEHDEDAEWVAHYVTQLEAMREREPDGAKPTERATACVRLVCDGCDQALGFEEMTEPSHGMHLDPADLGEWLTIADWTEGDDGHHWCHECPAPERDLSRVPGPNDVALPGLEAS